MGLIRLQNQLFICLLQDKPITSDQSIDKMDYRAINSELDRRQYSIISCFGT